MSIPRTWRVTFTARTRDLSAPLCGPLTVPYYGDISGSFKGLLSGETEVCVAVIVGGARDDCLRCPKRTVNNVQDISEARWYDLMETQKRRFIDCIRENRDCLMAGYATIRVGDLKRLSTWYKLYPPNEVQVWPVLVRSFAYFEIFNAIADTQERSRFYPDRFHSQPQQKLMEEELSERLPQLEVSASGSRQRQGIQTADCIAGAIREQQIGRNEWESLNDEFLSEDRGDWALNKLEARLSEY